MILLRSTSGIAFGLLLATAGHANNITTSNGSLVSNSGTQVVVEFDVSWENGWRIAPDRWDAAWLFVKYKTNNGFWHHAELANNGHVASPGHTLTTGLLDPALAYNAASNYGVGVFIYRQIPGASTITATDVNLIWTYTNAGISMADVAEVRVFAIEMVYVPQGAFAAGDGATGFTLTTINVPSATTAPTGVGSLGGQGGGYPTGQTAPTNASWPNGYNAFYCMKYEVSQQAYVDFLNTLTYSQQVTRTGNAPNSAAGTGALVTGNTNRNGIDIQTPGVASTAPAVYACNLDGDGIYGEVIGDGTDIACSYLGILHLLAYLDWSGLRPMTDLEYEKACRGTIAPVAGEYPWGNTSIAASAYTLANAGTNGEGVATNYSTTTGNALYLLTNSAIGGPVHVGAFANHVNNSGRVTAGASYYGIMEMGGNLLEGTVITANADGRAYTGAHGNGALTASGDTDVIAWPLIGGTRWRGGALSNSATTLRVSDRTFGTGTITPGSSEVGGRGARSAP